MNHQLSYSFKNVTLRPLKEENIESLRNWRNDDANSKYLRKIPYITEQMQRLWFENYLTNDNELYFAIYETILLNRIVGSLSLYNFNDKLAEFGKILIGDPDAHGKNIGVNSIKALLHIAFNDLNLNTIILHVFIDNTKAINVYKKVGFIIDDIHDKDDGNEYIMRITKDIFKEA